MPNDSLLRRHVPSPDPIHVRVHRPEVNDEPPDDWTWTEAETARLVLPRPGYGLGIKGNARNYYDATNSLLPFVLVWRRGIPIR